MRGDRRPRVELVVDVAQRQVHRHNDHAVRESCSLAWFFAVGVPRLLSSASANAKDPAQSSGPGARFGGERGHDLAGQRPPLRFRVRPDSSARAPARRVVRRARTGVRSARQRSSPMSAKGESRSMCQNACSAGVTPTSSKRGADSKQKSRMCPKLPFCSAGRGGSSCAWLRLRNRPIPTVRRRWSRGGRQMPGDAVAPHRQRLDSACLQSSPGFGD